MNREIEVCSTAVDESHAKSLNIDINIDVVSLSVYHKVDQYKAKIVYENE